MERAHPQQNENQVKRDEIYIQPFTRQQLFVNMQPAVRPKSKYTTLHFASIGKSRISWSSNSEEGGNRQLVPLSHSQGLLDMYKLQPLEST